MESRLTCTSTATELPQCLGAKSKLKGKSVVMHGRKKTKNVSVVFMLEENVQVPRYFAVLTFRIKEQQIRKLNNLHLKVLLII